MLYEGEMLKLWYGEDLYNVTETDNSGTSCADIYAIMSINQALPTKSVVKIGTNVCFGARDNVFGVF